MQLDLGAGSELHPLMATARLRRGEDSVDAGAEALRHRERRGLGAR